MAEEGGRVPMSPGLQATLLRARDYAASQSAPQVLLEHLLLALTEDADAAHVLEVSQVDLARLRNDVAGYIGSMPDRVPAGTPGAPAISTVLTQVLKYATLAAQQGRRASIDGAIVLAALVGDGRSMAAGFLKAQGLTFEAAIKALREASARPSPQAGPVSAAPPAGQPRDVQVEPSRMTSAVAPVPYEAPAASRAESLLAAARERIGNRVSQSPSVRTELGPRALQSAEPQSAAPAAEARPTPTAIDERPPAPVVEVPSQSPEYQPARPQTQVEFPVAAGRPSEGVPIESVAALARNAEALPAPVSPIAPALAGAPSGPVSEPAAGADTFPRTQPPLPPRGPERVAPQFPGSPTPPVGGATQPAQPAANWAPPPMTPRGPPPGQPAYRPGQAADWNGRAMPTPLPAGRGAVGERPPAGPPWVEPAPRRQTHQPMPSLPAPEPRPTLVEPQPTRAYAVPLPAGPGTTGELIAPTRGPAIDQSHVTHSIPLRMKQGRAQVIEVRVERPPLAGGGGGQRPHALRAETVVARAIAVRLRALSGRFMVDSASPETQWDQGGGGGGGRLASEAAVWRFTVTPLATGRGVLQLAVSARTIGADGVLAETQLPDDVVEVRAASDKRGLLKTSVGYVLAGLASVVVLKLIEGLAGFDIFFFVRQLLR